MTHQMENQDISDYVHEEIDEIIQLVFDVDGDEYDDETYLGPRGLGGESLDFVEVAERAEARTGIEIPDKDLEDMEMVVDVKSYIGERSDE